MDSPGGEGQDDLPNSCGCSTLTPNRNLHPCHRSKLRKSPLCLATRWGEGEEFFTAGRCSDLGCFRVTLVAIHMQTSHLKQTKAKPPSPKNTRPSHLFLHGKVPVWVTLRCLRLTGTRGLQQFTPENNGHELSCFHTSSANWFSKAWFS